MPERVFDKTDLNKAVDDFTNPTRSKLWRDDQSIEWVTLPSLWDQLVDAMETGAGGSGHGKQESKPPVDTAALSLVVKIGTRIRDASHRRGIKRTRDVPKDLRQLAAHALKTGPEEVQQLTLLVRDWCGDVRTICSSDPDRSWRMHGVACQECAATAVTETDKDGNDLRMPAIVVSWNNGLVRAVECRVCGTAWFRGPQLDKLAEDILYSTTSNDKSNDINERMGS